MSEDFRGISGKIWCILERGKVASVFALDSFSRAGRKSGVHQPHLHQQEDQNGLYALDLDVWLLFVLALFLERYMI